MNCPRCAVEMNRVQVSKLEVDLCPQCQGSWYDMIELSDMFALPDKLVASSHLADSGGPALDLEAPVKCPRCSEVMSRSQYLSGSSVMVDTCEKHGVWLDGGELKALLDHMADQVLHSVEEHATQNPGGFFQALKRVLSID